MFPLADESSVRRCADPRRRGCPRYAVGDVGLKARACIGDRGVGVCRRRATVGRASALQLRWTVVVGIARGRRRDGRDTDAEVGEELPELICALGVLSELAVARCSLGRSGSSSLIAEPFEGLLEELAVVLSELRTHRRKGAGVFAAAG